MASKTLLLLTSLLASLACAKPVAPANLPFKIVNGASNNPDGIELTASRQILVDIQKALGQDGYAALVTPAANAADTYFKGLLKTANPNKAIVSLMQIEAYAPNNIFNSTSVLNWLAAAGTGFPNAFLNTNPQHFMAYSGDGVAATNFTGALSVQLETWATASDSITVWYGAFEITEAPSYFPALPEYNMTLFSEMRLRDGTVFAHALTALRDLPDGSGVEYYLGMYLPENVDQWVSDALTLHITNEFTNWMRSAYAWALDQWYL
ncbi:hypothetical protein F5Y16DRAFT_409330 [Xylariaceae sp. FL0255]|nr:hypothetical protein F5Y16DRAFT_409330 [Xylariaceae sp. FL0255]